MANTEYVGDILAERGKRYGSFESGADVAMGLQFTVNDHLRGKALRNDVRYALQMICNKMARIINGDPEYVDNWDDIAGYAQLVADRIRNES